MVNEDLRVSIVTVSYNAETTIEKTIQSVLCQSYSDIEFIVIDGASDDGTLEKIQQCQDGSIKVISEKDDGIYDAMNKGLASATGDIVYFLNSDDQLHGKEVISNVAEQFRRDNELGILSGTVKFVDLPENPSYYAVNPKFDFRNIRDLIKVPKPQQSVFVRRCVFDQVGTFNTNYELCADYEWFLRAYNQRVKIRIVETCFANVSCQGLTFKRPDQIRKETFDVIRRNSSAVDFSYYLMLLLSRRLRKLVQGRIHAKI